MVRVIGIHQGQARPRARDDRLIPVIEVIRRAGRLGYPFLVPARFTTNHDDAESVRKSLYAIVRYYCSCGERNCCRKHNKIVECLAGASGSPAVPTS